MYSASDCTSSSRSLRPVSTLVGRLSILDLTRIRLLLPQAALSQKTDEVIIPAVRVEQDDLLEAVAPDLVHHTLQQLAQQRRLERQRAGEAARLVDLPEVEGGEDHGAFALG